MYRSGIVLPIYLVVVGSMLPTTGFAVLNLFSPVRRRVAQAGQGMSARTV